MQAHRAEIEKHGVTLIKGFYPKSLVHDALLSVEKQLDSMAGALKRSGKISSRYREYDIHSRLSKIEAEMPHAATLLHKQPTLSPAFKELWGGDQTVDKMSELLQTENLLGVPNWNLRCKTPEKSSKNHATVPFHQDAAYVDQSADNTFVLTAWAPLVPVTFEIGPMEYAKGPWWKHKRLLPHTGCWRNTWYLDLSEEQIAAENKPEEGFPVERQVFSEMEPGDAIVFDNYVPHRSIPNTTASTRWSVDLRWQNIKDPTGCNAPGVPMGKASKLGIGFSNIDWESSPINIPTPWREVEGEETHPPLDETDEEEAERLAMDELRDGLFCPLIGGPWMDRWEMNNVNEHVTAYREGTIPEISRNPKTVMDDQSNFFGDFSGRGTTVDEHKADNMGGGTPSGSSGKPEEAKKTTPSSSKEKASRRRSSNGIISGVYDVDVQKGREMTRHIHRKKIDDVDRKFKFSRVDDD